jgi:hypothetical protein
VSSRTHDITRLARKPGPLVLACARLTGYPLGAGCVLDFPCRPITVLVLQRGWVHHGLAR